MEDFQKKQNQKPKCKLVGEYPKDIKVKKSDLEDGKEFNEIKIEYKNIGEVNWNKKYTVDLVNNYNENINISDCNIIEDQIKTGEIYEVNIALLILDTNPDKYLLEFVLKNEKNDIVENSKAVFNLILENEEDNKPKPKRKDSSNKEHINNDDNLLTEEEIKQIYDELSEEMNIQNVIELDLFKLKLKDLIKKEKENYEGMSKEEIISNLKDIMTDLIL